MVPDFELLHPKMVLCNCKKSKNKRFSFLGLKAEPWIETIDILPCPFVNVTEDLSDVPHSDIFIFGGTTFAW